MLFLKSNWVMLTFLPTRSSMFVMPATVRLLAMVALLDKDIDVPTRAPDALMESADKPPEIDTPFWKEDNCDTVSWFAIRDVVSKLVTVAFPA